MIPVASPKGLTPALTPRGHLVLLAQEDAPTLDAGLASRLLESFDQGSGAGLLRLGACEVGQVLPAVFAYWSEFGGRFVTALCTQSGVDEGAPAMPAPPDDLAALSEAVPPMPGAEYLTDEVLRALWTSLSETFAENLAQSKLALSDFLKRLNPAWNVVGRVHFNLAENRKDEEAPFAFLATYTHRLSGQGKAQHLPLGQALREYSGAAHKQQLLSLLLPVQRAAERCGWLKAIVGTGEIFHPLRWSPREASQLLGDAAELERAGVVVRMPANWLGGRPSRPRVTATVGTKPPAGLGSDALLDFRMEVSLEGQNLTEAELKALLAGTDGLAFLRGQWVEVQRARLEEETRRFREAEQLAKRDGLSFAEAMRLVAGARVEPDDTLERADSEWSRIVPGPWLAEALQGLRAPDGLSQVDPGSELHATLRPYQQTGVRWLQLLLKLGLGACLADDMGLGKTIQIISHLLVLRRARGASGRPSLLVAPASLLANWAAEIERFAPTLRTFIAHTSAMSAEKLRSLEPSEWAKVDLVITSYGSLLRVPWLTTTAWELAVLDEAQAIKNPDAKQTRAVKKLQARARVALTGTPVENHLGDLWSIFDFINPGLLGSAKSFTRYTRQLSDRTHNPYGPLRTLVQPYILRRLKTDRSVIADLPDKTETKAFCQLTRKQAALYQQAVAELSRQLASSDGIQRRGVVLSSLMRLKQLCNHPSQWLGDGTWAEEESGKWARLRELAEVIAAKQEKVLVFTQFREVTAPLASFLGGVFGRPGLVLHGETQVKKRQELVRQFQEDEAVPFFILSLKAGGSGLNLTAASHVIHFDRWWNPAVEEQATDRAFRIGQKKNVLVHKFICRGTIEEKLDALIESKKQLSRELLDGGGELNLTELGDEELLALVSLDLQTALRNDP